MSRERKRTPEADALIAVEARRRADRLPPNERMSSKQIASRTGLTEMYVEQLISKARRQISTQVDVSCETSTAVDSTQGQAKA